MKRFNLFIILTAFIMMLGIVNCNGQPKQDYEFGTTAITGATTYHFFLEKKPAAGSYLLVQGMDYLAPDVTTLKVGVSTSPIFYVNLDNDGAEYRAGVVAENVAGFYSGLGVITGNVGTVPPTPTSAGMFFRKKQ